MFKIAYDGVAGKVTYVTARDAARGIGELIDEIFPIGSDETAAEIDAISAEVDRYTVVAV